MNEADSKKIVQIVEAIERRLEGMEARAVAADLFIAALLSASPDPQATLDLAEKLLQQGPWQDANNMRIAELAQARIAEGIAAHRRRLAG